MIAFDFSCSSYKLIVAVDCSHDCIHCNAFVPVSMCNQVREIMDIFIFFFIQFSSKYHQESQYIVFCEIILRKQAKVMGYHQSFFFIIVHTLMKLAMIFTQKTASVTLHTLNECTLIFLIVQVSKGSVHTWTIQCGNHP